jgi:hypothetical protein
MTHDLESVASGLASMAIAIIITMRRIRMALTSSHLGSSSERATTAFPLPCRHLWPNAQIKQQSGVPLIARKM